MIGVDRLHPQFSTGRIDHPYLIAERLIQRHPSVP
jgi:hypothetical protein